MDSHGSSPHRGRYGDVAAMLYRTKWTLLSGSNAKGGNCRVERDDGGRELLEGNKLNLKMFRENVVEVNTIGNG